MKRSIILVAGILAFVVAAPAAAHEVERCGVASCLTVTDGSALACRPADDGLRCRVSVTLGASARPTAPLPGRLDARVGIQRCVWRISGGAGGRCHTGEAPVAHDGAAFGPPLAGPDASVKVVAMTPAFDVAVPAGPWCLTIEADAAMLAVTGIGAEGAYVADVTMSGVEQFGTSLCAD